MKVDLQKPLDSFDFDKFLEADEHVSLLRGAQLGKTETVYNLLKYRLANRNKEVCVRCKRKFKRLKRNRFGQPICKNLDKCRSSDRIRGQVICDEVI